MSRRTSRFGKFVERARSEPGLGRNIIAILVLFGLGTSAFAYFMAHQRFNPPWEDKYSVVATFTEAGAVSPGRGQEVRIAGVPVGDIRESDVSRDGEALLTLRIDNDQEIYENARVVLRPKSPLNDMYVEISPGGPPAKKLADGAVLPAANSVSPVQVDEVLAHLDDNAQSAITALLAESDVALANAPTELPKGLRATDKTLVELAPVFDELKKRRDILARLVTSLGEISKAAGNNDERLTRLASSLQHTLSTFGERDKELDATLAELPAFSDQLRNASTSVETLVTQLNPTLKNLADASDDLPDALGRLDDSVDELDTFLEKAEPVLEQAKPVVGDLASASPHLVRASGDLRPITQALAPLTEMAVPYLDDLNAFFYNTNSVASLRDANRGILRGSLSVSPNSVPSNILEQLVSLGGGQ